MKRFSNKRRGRANLHNAPIHRLIFRNLCSDIPNDGMDARMNKFRVVFMHDFLLDNRLILGLLRIERGQKKELNREHHLEKQGVENGDTGTRVERRKRERNQVHEDVARAKEAYEADRNGQRIPDRELPDISGLVRMSARACRLWGDQVRNESKRRRRSWCRLDLHPSSRWCRRLLLNIGFKQSVLSRSSDGVEGVSAG